MDDIKIEDRNNIQVGGQKDVVKNVKFEKGTDSKKYKKYRIYFWIFTTLTVLSLLDMMTRDFMSSQYEIANGYLSFVLGLIFLNFGVNSAALITVTFDTIFSLVFIWIVLTFLMRGKMKKQKNN